MRERERERDTTSERDKTSEREGEREIQKGIQRERDTNERAGGR